MLSLSLFGCRGDGNSGSTGSEQDPGLEQTDSLSWELDTAKISIKLYLENSHSMGGYYGHRSRFYDRVDGIISDFMRDEDRFDLKCYTIAEKIEPYKNPQAFRTALDPTSTTKIAIGKSSPLDKILTTVTEQAQGHLNILITDGIISGSNEQIESLKRKGRNYNTEFITNLKNDIKIGLGKYARFYETKIFAYKSDFQASIQSPYYKLDNSKVSKGTFTNRPYYIILIGTPKIISRFEENYSIESDYNLEFEHFNDEDDVVKLPRFAITNNCTVSGSELLLKEGADNYAFSLLLDLKAFPKNYENNEFLEKNIQILHQGETLAVKSINVYKIKDRPEGSFRKDSRVVKEIQGFSHGVDIILEDFRLLGDDSITIQILKEYGDWYKEWGSMNDLKIEYDNEQTFGFEYFIQGIIDAYGGIGAPVLEHTILLKSK